MLRIILAAALALSSVMPAFAQDVFVEQNTQRWGGDYARVEVQSANACARQCAGDEQCLAWTYARPGTEADSGVCHLKATVPHRVEDPCCESGVVVGVSEATRPHAVRSRLEGETQSAAATP